MPLDASNPLEVVGAIVVYGVPGVAAATGAAWGLFTFFGREWLKQAFAKELKKLETREQAALKHVQEAIDHQIHRAKKLYDTEFEVMTKAWLMWDEARAQGLKLVIFAPSAPDWTQPGGVPRGLGLERPPEITDALRDRIARAHDPTQEYRIVFDELRCERLEKVHGDFATYLKLNGIFLRPEIQKRFGDLNGILFNAAIEFKYGWIGKSPHPDNPSRPGLTALLVTTERLGDELRALIEARLWSAEPTASVLAE